MIASGERMDFSSLSRPHRRQALDGRRRRQDHAAARARWSPRAGSPYPSCPGAASGTPAARSTSSRRSRAGAPTCPTRQMLDQLEDVGAVICAAGTGLAPGGQEALRAARRHRHRRGDPADRVLDHEQEDRRGHRRAGPRRQGRQRRVHEGRRPAPASWPRRWSRSAPTPASTTVALLTDMSTPLGRTAGNGLEVAESVDVLAGGGPRDVVELTLALAREMLRAAGVRRRRPGRPAGGRLGDGRLAADDRGPGRRPRRRRCRGPGRPTCVPAPAHRGADHAGRDGRRARRLAARAPAGPARRTRCRPRPASRCTPSPATPSPRGRSCCTLHTDEPERFERALAALADGVRRLRAGHGVRRHAAGARPGGGRLTPSLVLRPLAMRTCPP